MTADSTDGITARVPEAAGTLHDIPPRPWPVVGMIARGFLVVDKPSGCTSHDVVDQVRRRLHQKKVGHGGTLDPAVTGVLPLGLGQATRLLGLMLLASKTYECIMRVHGDVPPDRIRGALDRMIGTITQLPPVRSRVKRVERDRSIYALDVIGIEKREVRFTVRCEAGTYIRKLCHDVGENLGTGAHMAWLRRLSAGGFTLADAVSLESLGAAVDAQRVGDDSPLRQILRPPESVTARLLPRIWMDEGALRSVGNGVGLALPGVLGYTTFHRDDRVALLTHDGFLVALAIAQVDAATLPVETHGIVARPDRVFFPLPDAWPRDPVTDPLAHD